MNKLRWMNRHKMKQYPPPRNCEMVLKHEMLVVDNFWFRGWLKERLIRENERMGRKENVWGDAYKMPYALHITRQIPKLVMQELHACTRPIFLSKSTTIVRSMRSRLAACFRLLSLMPNVGRSYIYRHVKIEEKPTTLPYCATPGSETWALNACSTLDRLNDLMIYHRRLYPPHPMLSRYDWLQSELESSQYTYWAEDARNCTSDYI